MKHILIAVSLIVCTANCTGVRVRNSQNVYQANAYVVIANINDPIVRSGYTDSNGELAFNPYSPTTNAFDWNKVVPTGDNLVIVRLANSNEDYIAVVNHQYPQTCSLMYNNQYQSLPCRGMDLQTMAVLTKEEQAQLQAWLDNRDNEQALANVLKRASDASQSIIANLH